MSYCHHFELAHTDTTESTPQLHSDTTPLLYYGAQCVNTNLTKSSNQHQYQTYYIREYDCIYMYHTAECLDLVGVEKKKNSAIDMNRL